MVSDRADGAAGATAAPAPGFSLVPLVRVMRPYQWVKNLLLALPLAMSLEVDATRAWHVALAFVVFCLCASSAYVLNDLRDAEHDRQHPVKRHRPLAAGRVSRGAAFALAFILMALAFGLSLPYLPAKFSAMAGTYVVVTLSYSFLLKQRLLVDVFVLAGLYTLRVLAGGAAVPVEVTPWLLAFCIFFFLSLAFAKRYAELRRVQGDGTQIRGRAYQVEDIEVIANVGPTSGYMAVLVLALYVNSSTANRLYAHPFLLWLVCPLILYWVTRVWFLARRGVLSEDPLLFSMKDRTSLLVVAVTAVLVVLAAGGPPRRADGTSPGGAEAPPSSTGASRS
jgi:4-hydroxybenzoate polyprenyltransferase